MSMTEETKTKLESAGDSSDVDNGNCSSSGSGGDTKKTCVDCGTSRTPLWRGGPAGPKVRMMMIIDLISRPPFFKP